MGIGACERLLVTLPLPTQAEYYLKLLLLKIKKRTCDQCTSFHKEDYKREKRDKKVKKKI